jgi:hypothetical protein
VAQQATKQEPDVAEDIVVAVRRCAVELAELFQRPGQLIVHYNPENRDEPVKLEARCKL